MAVPQLSWPCSTSALHSSTEVVSGKRGCWPGLRYHCHQVAPTATPARPPARPCLRPSLAALQITAEQILRESKALQEAERQAPTVKITDPEELAEYRLQARPPSLPVPARPPMAAASSAAAPSRKHLRAAATTDP